MRTCRFCGDTLGMEEFRVRRKTGEIDTLRVCRECRNARNRANRHPDANDPPLPTDTHQRCQGCGKPLYPVADWRVERERPTGSRRWFCGEGCKSSILTTALDNLFPTERRW